MESTLTEGGPAPTVEPPTDPHLLKQESFGEHEEDASKSKKKKKKKKKARRKSLERTQSEVEDMKAAAEAQAQAQDTPEPEETQQQQEEKTQEQSETQETAEKEAEEPQEQTNNQSEDEALPGPPDLERTTSLDSLKATSTKVTSMFSRLTSMGRKKMPSRTESAAKLEGVVPSPVKTAVKKLEVPEEKDLDDLPMRTKRDFFEGSERSIHVNDEKEKYDAMDKQRQIEKEEAALKRSPPSSSTSNAETHIESAVEATSVSSVAVENVADEKSSSEIASLGSMPTMSKESSALQSNSIDGESVSRSEITTFDTEATIEAGAGKTEVEADDVVEITNSAASASIESASTTIAIEDLSTEAAEEQHAESTENEDGVSEMSSTVSKAAATEQTSESVSNSNIDGDNAAVAESLSSVSAPTKEQSEEISAETTKISSESSVAKPVGQIGDSQIDAVPTEELEVLQVAVAPPTSELADASTDPAPPEKMSPVKRLASRFEGKREQSLDSLKFRTVREFFAEERSVHVGAEKKKYEILTEQQKLKEKAEDEAKSKYNAGSSFPKSPMKESTGMATSARFDFKNSATATNVTIGDEISSSTDATAVGYSADNTLPTNVAEEAATTYSEREEKASSSPAKAEDAVTPVKSIASRFEGKREQSLDSLKFRTVREFFPEESSVRVGSEKQKFEAQSHQQQQDQSLDNLKFRTVREFFSEERSVHVGAEKAKFEALTKKQDEAAKAAEQTKSSPSIATKSDDLDSLANGSNAVLSINDDTAVDGRAVNNVDLASSVIEPAADTNSRRDAVVEESGGGGEVASAVLKSEKDEDTAEMSIITSAVDEVTYKGTSVTEELDILKTTVSANPAESSETSQDDIPGATKPLDSEESIPPTTVEPEAHPGTAVDVAENSSTQGEDTVVSSTSQLNEFSDNTDVALVSPAVVEPSEAVDTSAKIQSSDRSQGEETQEHDGEVNQPTETGLSEIKLNGTDDVVKMQHNRKPDAKLRPMLTTERSFVIEDDHTIETEDTIVVAERSMTDGEDEFESLSASELLPAHQLFAGIISPTAKETRAAPADNTLTEASHSSKSSPSPKLTRNKSVGSTGSANLTQKTSVGSTGSATLTRNTSVGSTGSTKLTRKTSISSVGSAKSPSAALTVPIPMKRASITAPTASSMAKKAAEAEELQKRSPRPKNGSAPKSKGTIGPTGFIKPAPAAPTVPISMKRASITAPTASYMARKAAEVNEAHQAISPQKSEQKVKGTVGPTGFIKPAPAAPTVPIPPRRASITAPTASWQARNVPNHTDDTNEIPKHHASKPKGTVGPTGFVKPIPPPPTVPVAPKRASISAPTASYMAKKSAEKTEEVNFAAAVSKPISRNSRYANVKIKVLDGIESGSTHAVVHKTITKEEFIAAERRKSLGAAGVSSVLSAVDRRASLAGGMSLEGPPEPFVRSALSRKKLNSTVPRYMNYENTPGYAQRAQEQYDRRKRLEMENAAKSEKRQKELRSFFAEKQRKALSSSADDLRRGMEAHEFAQMVKENELEAKKTLRKEAQRSRAVRSQPRALSASSSAGHSSSTGTASRTSKKSFESFLERKPEVEVATVEAEESVMPTKENILDEPEPVADIETVSAEGSATKDQDPFLDTNQAEGANQSFVIDEDPALENVAKKINFDEASIDSDEKDISTE
ncbi:hypothetical protein PHYBOEH_003546 [Phytophthora boehmeriae]|uniref:Uncharacterized protein n=1 Tax=Phytophthora boehmeriae TaxID=109152 RepID=A0A8T1X7Z2_9STRA|nr:hypothetical protein PHYBOEH_003546 [Phytophthora boehmeriae]